MASGRPILVDHELAMLVATTCSRAVQGQMRQNSPAIGNRCRQMLFVAIGCLPVASCSEPEGKPAMSEPSSLPSEPLTAHERPGEDRIHVIDGAVSPWGGYGDILVHGMSSHLGPDEDNRIRLERTGPFVPPITFPGMGDIVVTDKMRAAMERAGFRGITFRPVVKARIVEVPWHTWDLTARNPPYYPENGEPEEYILDEEHSDELANEIGDLWEVVLRNGAEMERLPEGPDDFHIRFRYLPRSWKGDDLFSVDINGYKYASPRARRWFEKHFPRWTSFRDGTEH